MSFTMTANKGGSGPQEQAPAGNHPAVLVALVDLGTQHEEFQGEAKWVRKVLLVWELPTKKKANGAAHLIDAAVTMSLNEKATLRKYAEAMSGAKIADGAPFDVTALVGKACMLNVLTNEKGYSKVAGVAGFPDLGVPPPKPTVEPFVCALEDFQGGRAVPAWVPWQYSRAVGQRVSVADYVKLCKEIAGDGSRKPMGATAGAGDDTLPF